MKPIYQLFFGLVLLNMQMSFAQNGTLDNSFSEDGKVSTSFGNYDSSIHSMALQNDRKIIVGGTVFDHGSYSQIGLARYRKDGSLDSKFGEGGKVVSSFLDFKMSLNSIVLEPNGKIIGAGIIYNNYTDSQFFLIRYNKNGTLDKSFGVDGIIIRNSVNINSLTLQPDGKIIAAGFSFDESNKDFMLIRFNKNGKLDTTFGVNGIVTTSIGNRDLGYDVALQSNGKIILSGTLHNTSGAYNTDIAIMRFNRNGKLDTAFGTNGIALIDNGDIDGVRSVKIQSDDKILFTGWYGSPYAFIIERLKSNGKLDTDFGTNGKVLTDISFGGESEEAIEIQADGKIIVAGRHEKEGGTDIALARYDKQGNLDTDFGVDGYIITPFSTTSRANCLKLQSDGRIIVGGEAGTTGGTYSPDFAVLRYNSELSLNANPNPDKSELLSNTEFNERKNAYKVYSNPFDKTLNLDFNLDKSEVLSINLYDINGKRIKEFVKGKTFENGPNNLKLELPETMSKGIYILNISNTKNTFNIKIVK